MTQAITIAELTPKTKGTFSLRFEVEESTPSQNPDEIHCLIVD